jgi:hypothetical protein
VFSTWSVPRCYNQVSKFIVDSLSSKFVVGYSPAGKEDRIVRTRYHKMISKAIGEFMCAAVTVNFIECVNQRGCYNYNKLSHQSKFRLQ